MSKGAEALSSPSAHALPHQITTYTKISRYKVPARFNKLMYSDFFSFSNQRTRVFRQPLFKHNSGFSNPCWFFRPQPRRRKLATKPSGHCTLKARFYGYRFSGKARFSGQNCYDGTMVLLWRFFLKITSYGRISVITYF